MALLTVATLTDEICDEVPGKSQEPIVRAVNKVVRRIQTEFLEPLYDTFTTRVKTTSGTATVTLGATLVTFSGTPLASTDPLMLIQIEGDDAWFLFTYASTSTGNLGSAWAEASGGSKTYTIVYPAVTFPNGVGQILSIERRRNEPLEYRPGGGWPDRVGTVHSWSPYYHNEGTAPADDATRIFLKDAPTDAKVYGYWYQPKTTRLTPGGATSQTIPLPDIWADAVIQGTLYYCWKQERRDASEVVLYKGLFEEALVKARAGSSAAATIPPRVRHQVGFLVDHRPVGDT